MSVHITETNWSNNKKKVLDILEDIKVSLKSVEDKYSISIEYGNGLQATFQYTTNHISLPLNIHNTNKVQYFDYLNKITKTGKFKFINIDNIDK